MPPEIADAYTVPATPSCALRPSAALLGAYIVDHALDEFPVETENAASAVCAPAIATVTVSAVATDARRLRRRPLRASRGARRLARRRGLPARNTMPARAPAVT